MKNRETEEVLSIVESTDADMVYEAKLASVALLRARGKTNKQIEERLGIKLKPEHTK